MAEQKEKKDAFKETFKLYKRRNPLPDFTRVVNFNSGILDPESIATCSLIERDHSMVEGASQLGLIDPSSWKVYSIKSRPGLIFLCNPFQDGGQRYWIERCIYDYPCLPNRCNLDVHLRREGDGRLWPPVFEGSDSSALEDSSVYKLRWVTLGYHYDWDSKEYSPAQQSDFPVDLDRLSSFILKTLGFPNFRPEAGIVNYYHMDSTLSGHTDHSELDHSAPLISISFGQTAVFLIGGLSKSVEPIALFIQSGDVIIMSGESRLYYHGIPKILPVDDGELPFMQCKDAGMGISHEHKLLYNFMKTTRINVNIRQVYPNSVNKQTQIIS